MPIVIITIGKTDKADQMIKLIVSKFLATVVKICFKTCAFVFHFSLLYYSKITSYN